MHDNDFHRIQRVEKQGIKIKISCSLYNFYVKRLFYGKRIIVLMKVMADEGLVVVLNYCDFFFFQVDGSLIHDITLMIPPIAMKLQNEYKMSFNKTFQYNPIVFCISILKTYFVEVDRPIEGLTYFCY